MEELYLCGEEIVGYNFDYEDEGPERILINPTLPGVSYDASTNTLTLNNASLTLSGHSSAALSYLGSANFTLKLVGSNTFTAETDFAGYAIQVRGSEDENKQGSFSIVGGGSLKTNGFSGLIWQDWVGIASPSTPSSDIAISNVTLVGEGDGIVSNFGNLTIKDSKITVIASDPHGFFGITTGRTFGDKQYYGKLTIANSRVELKYTGSRWSSDRTTLAWNTLNLNGENVYIGTKTAEGKVNLSAYAQDEFARHWCSDKYLLITTENLNVPTLTVATPKVILSKKKFTYNGKAQKPKVTVKVNGKTLTDSNYTLTWPKGRKNVGSYDIEVILKGQYRGHKTVSYEIVPKATMVKKLVPQKKAATVKWKKASGQLNGYEIQYSLKKSFKSSKTVKVKGAKKTTATIKKLKAHKKYFVRIRTYKDVKHTSESISWHEKYYSAWSKAKVVKTQ